MGKAIVDIGSLESNVRTFDTFQDRYERKNRLRSAHTEADCQIWQCLDRTSGEECSMKVMKKNEANRVRFLQEVAILKECNGHPNLIHVRNVYECKKFYYVVTDSLKHPNVLQALESLKKSGNTKESAAAKVAVVIAAVLNGLVYCHGSSSASKLTKKRICHGKIHPRNVLIPDPSMIGNLMLVDFSGGKMDIGLEAVTPDNSESEGEDDEPVVAKKNKRGHFDPPEFSRTGPTAKGDMWSLGVLTFLLLTGKYPFAKPSDMELPIQEWHGIRDKKCQQFVQACLQHNPKHRPKAKEINQKQAWFNAAAEFSLYDSDLGEVMYRLGTLNREHEFQVAVRSYISTSVLQKSDRARLEQIFRVADVNNDNSLSRKEFEKVLKKADIDFLGQGAIDNFFQILDTNGDNEVSYTEFMAFAEDRELLFEKNRLRVAFDAFDWSHTGYITAEDLKHFSQSAGGSAAFRGESMMEDDTILEMIQKADQDGDGKISFDEFVDMMVGCEKTCAGEAEIFQKAKQ